ncbi:cupin domain-containing protein [Marivirga arenosa]|uniref:Cupin domain-containing protein n=1 Tax=Marivirga arenosa TaxID=3059076 RepID=A0AA51RCE2_9BACT|nr:cupin domain-containing protein [Marivirga sp. ABR2-2]WMN06289.1 cupin domain-containing protein [Marivirga sp. ABR2-2]
MKHIKELHEKNKGVSAKPIFKSSLGGNTTSIQLLKNEKLKEHSSKTDALLICIEGKVLYQDKDNNKYELKPGYYVEIKANVKHELESILESHLILIR